MKDTIRTCISDFSIALFLIIFGVIIGTIGTMAYFGNLEFNVGRDKIEVNLIEPGLQIQEIAKDWADSHNYTLGETISINTTNGTQEVKIGRYACDNFSRDLIHQYENNGYEAEYCRGDALWCNPWEEEDKSCSHAWVKVCTYVEATNGEMLDSETYRQRYIEEECYPLNSYGSKSE